MESAPEHHPANAEANEAFYKKGMNRDLPSGQRIDSKEINQ